MRLNNKRISYIFNSTLINFKIDLFLILSKLKDMIKQSPIENISPEIMCNVVNINLP